MQAAILYTQDQNEPSRPFLLDISTRRLGSRLGVEGSIRHWLKNNYSTEDNPLAGAIFKWDSNWADLEVGLWNDCNEDDGYTDTFLFVSFDDDDKKALEL